MHECATTSPIAPRLFRINGKAEDLAAARVVNLHIALDDDLDCVSIRQRGARANRERKVTLGYRGRDRHGNVKVDGDLDE